VKTSATVAVTCEQVDPPSEKGLDEVKQLSGQEQQESLVKSR
jgi:hypothetical protein